MGATHSGYLCFLVPDFHSRLCLSFPYPLPGPSPFCANDYYLYAPILGSSFLLGTTYLVKSAGFGNATFLSKLAALQFNSRALNGVILWLATLPTHYLAHGCSYHCSLSQF
ncbi:hypothetical protein BJX63DRAFT_408709 [Aspergillus granulosus]|uniref:Uncharacterized protein n=1 Tax=Aspergillus granulosus TaxID=176169 RepID=A0ABR4GZQ3_9EURO